MAFVHWTVMGDVEPLLGGAGVVGGLLLGAAAMVTDVGGLRVAIFLTMTLTVIGYPFVQRRVQDNQRRRVVYERMEAAYANLLRSPDHAGAAFTVAQLLVVEGHPERGVAVAEAALRGKPHHGFAEEFRLLNVWRRFLPPDAPEPSPTLCPACRRPHDASVLICTACRSPLYLSWVEEGTPAESLQRRLSTAWLVAVVVALGCPAAVSLLPPLAAMGVILALLIGGAVLLWRAFRGGWHAVGRAT